MVEFLPTLLLVAALGLLLLGHRGLFPIFWWALRLAVTAAVAYSAAFSVFAAINHDGKFAVVSPSPMRPWRASSTGRCWPREKLHPATYGPAEMTVRFPMNRPGVAEPIGRGGSYGSDYLYAVYGADGRHLQLRLQPHQL